MYLKDLDKDTLPMPSDKIAWIQVIEITGINPTRLTELIEIGWIEPDRTQGDEYLFRRKDVYRLRKLERLCRDFTLNALGGSIVVDLLDRIEYLENKIKELGKCL